MKKQQITYKCTCTVILVAKKQRLTEKNTSFYSEKIMFNN